jgi:putative hydrolase of the HAD superfamily
VNIEKTLQQPLIERIRRLNSPMKPKATEVSARLLPLTKIRVVLFDIYGTLFISGSGDIGVASKTSNQQALTEALRFGGFSGDVEEAGKQGTDLLLQAIQETHEVKRRKGIQYPEVDIRDEWQIVLSALRQEKLIEGKIHSDTIIRISVDYECQVNPVWPMPDVQATVQQLRDRGMLLGIVSNAQFYTMLIFPALLEKPYSELGLLPELCAWSFAIGEAKPSTRMFEGILKYLDQTYGITPTEVLYVGNDMLNDIWAASQCGLKTALFAGDQRSLRLRENDPRCAGLEPDVILTKLSQLLQIIDTVMEQ